MSACCITWKRRPSPSEKVAAGGYHPASRYHTLASFHIRGSIRSVSPFHYSSVHNTQTHFFHWSLCGFCCQVTNGQVVRYDKVSGLPLSKRKWMLLVTSGVWTVIGSVTKFNCLYRCTKMWILQLDLENANPSHYRRRFFRSSTTNALLYVAFYKCFARPME